MSNLKAKFSPGLLQRVCSLMPQSSLIRLQHCGLAAVSWQTQDVECDSHDTDWFVAPQNGFVGPWPAFQPLCLLVLSPPLSFSVDRVWKLWFFLFLLFLWVRIYTVGVCYSQCLLSGPSVLIKSLVSAAEYLELYFSTLILPPSQSE